MGAVGAILLRSGRGGFLPSSRWQRADGWPGCAGAPLVSLRAAEVVLFVGSVMSAQVSCRKWCLNSCLLFGFIVRLLLLGVDALSSACLVGAVEKLVVKHSLCLLL